MCRYENIESWKLSNGKTIAEVNNAVHDEIERIYRDAWSKGVAVPYFDGKGNTILANPDGSDDAVDFDVNTRKYTVKHRVAAPMCGRMAYLLRQA